MRTIAGACRSMLGSMIALVVAWGFATGPLAAQAEGLSRVEALVGEGRFAESRSLLEDWLDERWDAAPRADREHGLWLRALLTIDPVSAELDYRRLVVEYPGGPFSDQALLRLAQGAEARGEVAAARRYLEILVRDYPQSPQRMEARTSLARLPDEAPAPSAQDSDPVAATRPPVEETAPAAGQSAPAIIPVHAYTLQLGAFSEESSARAFAADPQFSRFGLRYVRVEGSPLVRVRFGGFATEEEAQALRAELQDVGVQVIVSADGDRETPIP